MATAVANATLNAAADGGYFDATGRLTRVGERRRDRLFSVYTVANGMSFNMVSASFVQMYAIAYGADERVTGLLSGIISMSMVAGFFSLFFLALFGPSRLMGYAWSGRYVFATGLLAAPWVAAQPQFGHGGAITLIVLCILGFSAMRAIGASAWLPLIHTMTTEDNRVAFMTGNSFRFRIGGSLGIGGAITYLSFAAPGQDADPNRLWWVILVGVLVGLVATGCLFLMPQQNTAAERPDTREMRRVAVSLIRRPALRFFFLAVMLIMMGIGLFQAQRVYFLKQVVHLTVTQVAWIEAVSLLGAAGCLYGIRRLAARFGEMAVLRSTILAMILVSGLFGMLPANPWILGAALLVWYTGMMWVFLCSDRTMLSQCDQSSSKVLPVVWSSTNALAMGLTMMFSGHLVRFLGDLLPGLSHHALYGVYDKLVVIVLLAGMGVLGFGLSRYPLQVGGVRTQTDEPEAAHTAEAQALADHPETRSSGRLGTSL